MIILVPISALRASCRPSISYETHHSLIKNNRKCNSYRTRHKTYHKQGSARGAERRDRHENYSL